MAGAYEYSLYQGLPNAMNGNWYLRSQGGSSEPQWRPEIGGYLGNQSIVGVMQTQTLFDRKGTQFKSANDSAWGRIVTGSQDSKAAGHHVDMNTDYTLIQVGGDLLTLSLGDQGINVGLMASYGDAQTDSTGNRSANGDRYKANGSVDGYSLGMYATWFADAKEERGAYVDSWLQHGWYSNSVNGEGMSSDSYDSRLWTASLESGYIWAMNEDKFSQWSLAPQAQVVYSHYSADSLTDVSGTEISNQKGESWTVRVGSRVMGRLTAGDSLFHPYAELNWLYNRQPASVAFDGENVQMNAPKNRAEVKVGVQSEFDSRWSTWIHFDAQTGADDYRQYSGGISVRYSW
ncbi:Outer membrane protein IcsA autotransporter precursor [Leminorella grimontii]|nr:Outer membrane protein IcsA autotransporter precursor [Leminorella grimontii]